MTTIMNIHDNEHISHVRTTRSKISVRIYLLTAILFIFALTVFIFGCSISALSKNFVITFPVTVSFFEKGREVSTVVINEESAYSAKVSSAIKSNGRTWKTFLSHAPRCVIVTSKGNVYKFIVGGGFAATVGQEPGDKHSGYYCSSASKEFTNLIADLEGEFK